MAAAKASVGPSASSRAKSFGACVQLIGGMHFRDEAKRTRFVRIQHPVAQREIERAMQADEARRDPGRAAIGRDAGIGVGHHRLRAFGGEHDVGREGQAKASAGREHGARRR
ncbi:MAG: hypothetical protein R3C16_09375 [Hyphomonadaceae bacterium]